MIQLTLGDPYPTPPQWIRASFTRPKILMSSTPAAVAPADCAATVAEKVDWCRNNFRYLRDPQQDIWFEKKFVLKRRLFGGGLRKLRAGDCEDFEGFLLEELTEAGVVKTDASHQSSTAGVFCVGDMEVGASHVVRAISAGQEAAESIDRMLART